MINRAQVALGQGPQSCSEEALLDHQEATGSNRRWCPQPSGAPVCDDNVTEAGSLPPATLARDHGDDDVRAALVGVGRNHARRPAFHPAQVRVGEWDEDDVAARERQLRRRCLRHVVVNLILF